MVTPSKRTAKGQRTRPRKGRDARAEYETRLRALMTRRSGASRPISWWNRAAAKSRPAGKPTG